MYRIWTETLPSEELSSDAVLRLLKRYRLQPLVALPQERQTPAMLRAFQKLHAMQVPIGIWPLLDDEDGYWASVTNAQKFANRVWEALVYAKSADVPIATVAIDLEPSETLKRRLMRGTMSARYTQLRKCDRAARTARGEREYREAVACYSALSESLRGDGIESLAIAIPPVLLDVACKSVRWQKMFGVPVTEPRWATLSPMVYTSMLRSLLPRGLTGLGPVLLKKVCATMSRVNSDYSTCVSIGVVGKGEMKDEVCYSDISELARDVATVKNAGIGDLALFSLEGVLDRRYPEAWLEALVG
ncbi:MAG: hypothetical protein JKY56_15950 [Kofleriaceae bacterium]|nr:hypothetical protein [Kofleriaceae bacterium]